MSAVAMKFAVESFGDAITEAYPLIARHYGEIAWKRESIPLDVNQAQYLVLEAKNMLRIHTARVNGSLVGYSAWFLTRHLHYRQTLFANNDVLYIAPEYRGGAGAAFIQFCEADLRACGAHAIILHIKSVLDWSRLAQNLGYEQVETIHQKWVGD